MDMVRSFHHRATQRAFSSSSAH